MKTVSELLNELAGNLETRTRNSGEKFVCLKDNSPDWMTDVMHKAHGDRMPDDDVYSRIYDIVNHMSTGYDDIKTIDDAKEALMEIEPDIYTSELTAWLNSRNDNVYYLTEALEESGTKDGFQLLSYAQHLYIIEIGENLLSAISELADEDC